MSLDRIQVSCTACRRQHAKCIQTVSSIGSLNKLCVNCIRKNFVCEFIDAAEDRARQRKRKRQPEHVEPPPPNSSVSSPSPLQSPSTSHASKNSQNSDPLLPEFGSEAWNAYAGMESLHPQFSAYPSSPTPNSNRFFPYTYGRGYEHSSVHQAALAPLLSISRISRQRSSSVSAVGASPQARSPGAGATGDTPDMIDPTWRWRNSKAEE